MRLIMLALAATSLAMPVAVPTAAFAHDGYNGKIWRNSQGRLRCKRPRTAPPG